MWSTDEIVQAYNYARNKKKQINILAELNAVDVGTIRRILINAGCDIGGSSKGGAKKKWSDELLGEMEVLIENGNSFEQVVEKLSLDINNTTTKSMYYKVRSRILDSGRSIRKSEVGTKKNESSDVIILKAEESTPSNVLKVEKVVEKEEESRGTAHFTDDVMSFMRGTVSELRDKVNALELDIQKRELELNSLRDDLKSYKTLLDKMGEIYKGDI